MNKTIATIVVLVVLVGGGIFIINKGSNANKSSVNTLSGNTNDGQNNIVVGGPNSSGSKTYTLTDISTHKDATSCFTAINGSVYDVTSWIDQHPGGREAILYICGKDGSAAFNTQHGDQTKPEQELKKFFIGKLVQ